MVNRNPPMENPIPDPIDSNLSPLTNNQHPPMAAISKVAK
jgi:hypothetical protein